MAAPSGKTFGSGFRHLRGFKLNAAGIIDAPDEAVPYEGFRLIGGRVLEATTPDVRRIAHVGDDHLLAQTMLPRIEPSGLTFRLAAQDMDAYAVLSGTKVRTVGEMVGVGHQTSKAGFEPDVALMGVQSVQDQDTSITKYIARFYPSAKIYAQDASWNENANEFSYTGIPNVVDHHIWGIEFTEADDGYLTAEYTEFEFDGFPWIAAWLGDNVAATFSFDTDRPASATAKINVFVYDVGTGAVTLDAAAGKTTGGVTPTAVPGVGDILIVVYELATAP